MHGGTVHADPEPDSGFFRLFSFPYPHLSNAPISWHLGSSLILLQIEETALNLCLPANKPPLTAFLLRPATAEDSSLSLHRRYWRLACSGIEYSYLFENAFPCLGKCLTILHQARKKRIAHSTFLVGTDARFSSDCWPQSIGNRCLIKNLELVVPSSGVGGRDCYHRCGVVANCFVPFSSGNQLLRPKILSRKRSASPGSLAAQGRFRCA